MNYILIFKLIDKRLDFFSLLRRERLDKIAHDSCMNSDGSWMNLWLDMDAPEWCIDLFL